MARTAYTPCDWPDCDRSPVDGWALFRVNPKGETGIFMCSEHAGASPEEVADLMDTVAEAMGALTDGPDHCMHGVLLTDFCHPCEDDGPAHHDGQVER